MRVAFERQRRLMAPSLRELASDAIRTTLRAECKLESVGLYAPLTDEPDIRSLIIDLDREGVRVFLPRFRAPDSIVFARFESWECLELGRFGILEPSAESALAAPESLSAAVLPGVAFDLDGFRLGRGRAVYDRCFSAKATRPRLIGIAFDWQLIERVPREVHDLAMDLVITESRRVEPRKSTR